MSPEAKSLVRSPWTWSDRGDCAAAIFCVVVTAFAAGWATRDQRAQRELELEATRVVPVPAKPINFAWDVPCPELREICKVRARMTPVQATNVKEPR